MYGSSFGGISSKSCGICKRNLLLWDENARWLLDMHNYHYVFLMRSQNVRIAIVLQKNRKTSVCTFWHAMKTCWFFLSLALDVGWPLVTRLTINLKIVLLTPLSCPTSIAPLPPINKTMTGMSNVLVSYVALPITILFSLPLQPWLASLVTNAQSPNTLVLLWLRLKKRKQLKSS